jgi:hypothetical protein
MKGRLRSGQPAPSPSPVATATEILDRHERALAEREATLIAREQDVTRRERQLLQAEVTLTRQGVAGPSQSAPGPDLSTRISAIDLSAAPLSREESRARAELILAVGRKFGSSALATPAPDVARDPVVQQALRVLEQRQTASQEARLEREVQAKAQADAIVAVGKNFGSRVLANDE